ncbi:uncharacterized protein [Elaeis guineensis]|uniref:peptidylprolyl isomerase n=1 Tax=Elaeis guineensis var. tenera TaxID=51953 RepID=A0A6I9QGS9_ELAGV|nr:uncharacterized protein LOC105035340 isoform X1 [Elaeis guineensis]
MALMAMTTIGPRVPFQRIRAPRVMVLMRAETSVSFNKTVDNVAIGNAWEGPYQRLLFSCGRDYMSLSWPTFATGSGLEASITDQKKNDLSLDNVKIVVESRDDDKIHVRVDLTGEETQKAFDDILTNLARTAPPIPGFRRTKGGKTTNVPKSFLLQVLGKDRVTKFLIEDIVGITIGDYVEKEKLKVKSRFKTTQTVEELESAFTPGSEFGFNATIDFDKSDLEATSPGSS